MLMAKIKTKTIIIDDNTNQIIINNTGLNILTDVNKYKRNLNTQERYFDVHANELIKLRGIEFFKMLLIGKYITQKEYDEIKSTDGFVLSLVRNFFSSFRNRDNDDNEISYSYKYENDINNFQEVEIERQRTFNRSRSCKRKMELEKEKKQIKKNIKTSILDKQCRKEQRLKDIQIERLKELNQEIKLERGCSIGLSR